MALEALRDGTINELARLNKDALAALPDSPQSIGEYRPERNGKSHPLSGKQASSIQKLRGGYYTPAPIASFLANWAICDPNVRVLEPSVGDGALIEPILPRLGEHGTVVAVEIDPIEARKVAARGSKRLEVVEQDFSAWYLSHEQDGAFDVAIGNPPFVRYGDFPEIYREPAFTLMREEGLHPNRLTNMWLPFVVGCTRALRTGGRLALVLPAELLQVAYAAELREYLVRRYSYLTIITFKHLVFSGIQQETILLLGVRQDNMAAQISFIELDDIVDLSINRVEQATQVEVDLDHGREKWTQYYLTPAELGLIRDIEQSHAFGRLGYYGRVDVGVVTGFNDFFVMTEEEAVAHGVREWCVPLVGRSAQVPGLVLRQNEWAVGADKGGKNLLMQLGKVQRTHLQQAALEYVQWGESHRIHEGYKCRTRQPTWWYVPSVWPPDAFLLRQIHAGPRIIANHAGATCTDTIHRVRATLGTDADWLAAASINSLTFTFAEIRGRSYGGGVLELEPTEAEGLPFPKPGREPLPLDDLDSWLRVHGIDSTLEEVDRRTLRAAGLPDVDIARLKGIWKKLSQRRLTRKSRPKKAKPYWDDTCGGRPL